MMMIGRRVGRLRALEGAALLALALALGGGLDRLLGLRAVAFCLGLAAGLALVAAVGRRRWRRTAAAPRQAKGRRAQGAGPRYDLASDRSTDDQRWLM